MLVSIICPCRNEIRHIDAFLQSILRQKAIEFEFEVLVADGASDDGTAAVLATWPVREPRVLIIPNVGRIVSTGLNAAIRRSRGEIVVRMDLHTDYADDYVSQCVAGLVGSRAMCVGGPWRARGSSSRQRAIAAAFGSALGSGGAKSRRIEYNGPVDTVYLGAWWRSDLVALGAFDETLVRNQDDELCLRIVRAGGLIWQSSAIRSFYVPRDNFGDLWRQFYEYGYWKVAVIRKHRMPGAYRHIVPSLFLALLTALALVGILVTAAWILSAGLMIAYIVAVALSSVIASESRYPTSVGLVALSTAIMHFAYGLGFARGIVDFALLRKGKSVGSNPHSKPTH